MMGKNKKWVEKKWGRRGTKRPPGTGKRSMG